MKQICQTTCSKVPRSRSWAPTRSQNGYTLIEILLVMSIFSIGILGIMTLHVTSINSNAKARIMLMGSTLLTDQFEKLISADYARPDLDPGEAVRQAENGFVVQQSVFTTPIPNIKKIDLTITVDELPARSFTVTYYKRNPG